MDAQPGRTAVNTGVFTQRAVNKEKEMPFSEDRLPPQMEQRATAVAASDEATTGPVVAELDSASRTGAATTTTTTGDDGRLSLINVQELNTSSQQQPAQQEDGESDELVELRDSERQDVWHNGMPSVDRGYAPTTLAALAAAHQLTLVCSAPGCKALVDMQAARRKARAAGRTTYAPGDGCAGRDCSGHFRPGQYRSRQRKMAAALSSGGRKLIRWPASLGATAVWQRPRWAAAAAAEAALEAVAEPPAAPPPRTRARAHPIP